MAEEFKSYATHLINLHLKYIKTQKSNTQKNSYQTSYSPQTKMVDITEILILQGILNYPDKKDIILGALDSSMFQNHKQEFEYLLNGQIDKLTSVLARTELKTLTLEEYKTQLCMFLYKFYKNQYLLVANDKVLNFKEKAKISKEFKIIEKRLKEGNPIKYFNLRNQ